MKKRDKTDSSYGNMLGMLETQRRYPKLKLYKIELSLLAVLLSWPQFQSRSTSSPLTTSCTWTPNQSNFFLYSFLFTYQYSLQKKKRKEKLLSTYLPGLTQSLEFCSVEFPSVLTALDEPLGARWLQYRHLEIGFFCVESFQFSCDLSDSLQTILQSLWAKGMLSDWGSEFPLLLQLEKLQAFLWLSNIPLYKCTTTSLSIHLLMDIEVVYMSWLL